MSAEKSRLAKVLLLIFVAGVFGPVWAYARSLDSRLESVAYHFDFESGSVGAWSSYPPAQDTAYDPTIRVKRITGSAGLVLVREIRPNYPIDYVFGVRKKLDLLIDGDSRIAFRYFVKNYGKTEAVIVKLGLADGTAREIRIPPGENGAWHSADVSLAEFAAPAKPVGVQALALMAACVKADPEAGLAFAVDDVRVTGQRPKRAAILDPRSHWLEEFSAFVAGRHYDQGEAIGFGVELPLEAAGGIVRLTSVLPEGKPFTIPLEKTGRTFQGRAPGNKLKPGFWRADFIPRSGQRDGDPTTLYFLVRAGNAPSAHPRLFLSAPEKGRLLELIGRPGRARDIWEETQAAARSYRSKYDPDQFNYNLDAYDEVFWLPTYGGYSNTIRTLSSFARSNGIVYALGGDQEAGRAARQALLKMVAWPTFVHPHILNQGQFTYWPVGLVLIDLSVAYDLVYDLLSAGERQTIAAALFHKGITEVFKEYVRDNRVSSDTSNWISHVTGGGILGAIAVSGEIGDEDLEPCLTGMILKVVRFVQSTFDEDGDYGEGYAYHNFTMQTLCEIMPVLAAHFGIVLPDEVNRSHLYLPYQLNSESREVYDFGDTGARLLPMSNFAYVLHATHDPLLGWLYGLAPGAAEADLEYAADAIRPDPPAGRLPLVKLFRDVGTAVFRSGFGPNDFSFVFRAGPFSNHQHFDQGSFFLADRGEDFLVEGGRTDYYNDPWYQAFFIQPGAHNCLLVDENVESQRAGDLLHDVPAWHDFARITDFLEFAEGACLSAELAPIYKGKFKTLRRAVLYLKPRTIVLLDSGAGGRDAARLDLRFHVPLMENIGLDGDGAHITRGNRELALRTLYPPKYAPQILKRPLSLDEFRSENPLTMKARGFFQLTADITEGTVQVLNIMSTDEASVAGVALNDRGNHLELEIDGRLFLIRRPGGGGGFDADGQRIDADLFWRSGRALRALRASEIREGDRLIFRADQPVSLALETNVGSTTLSVSAAGESTLRLSCASRPRRVERNGIPIRSWSWAGRLLTLKVPGGQSLTKIID
jgi:hypothetical protein